MARNNNDQARVRDYLLGHLSSEQQQRIEERLMVEDDLFEEFEISKGELIEEYRAGELTGKDNQWFESHYLASREGKQNYTFALALNCLERPAPQPQQLNWFERLLTFFQQPRWALATVTPVLLLAIAGWLIFSQSHGSNRTTLAVALETNAISRALSDPKFHRIQLAPDIGDVKIDLMLPDSVARSNNYRVELDNRSGTTNTLSLSTIDTRSVSVIIPSDELPPGLYALKLTAINADGAEQRIGDYFFEVTN